MSAIVRLPVFAPLAECKGCGACCKTSPGATVPDDWGNPPNFDTIRDALTSGRWLVDWWEGDPRLDSAQVLRAYYLRPAVVGFEGEAVAREAGFMSVEGQEGTCTFHNAKRGCTSTVKPAECSALQPTATRECKAEPPQGYRRWSQRAAELWLPYSEQLIALAWDVKS